MSPKMRRTLLAWALLAPIVLVILFPFAVMLFTALKPADEVFSFPSRWLPQHWRWQNFADMWTEANFGTALANSLVVSICSTVLALAASVPAAYALARFSFRGRGWYRQFLLVTQMLAPVLLVLGLFKMAANMELVDSHLGVIVAYAAFNVAFAVWMLSSYFATIPRDLEEAAWLEGASRTRTAWTVFLPLATPAIAVTAIFTFINAWNEFAVVYTLVRSPENKTLTVQVVDMVAGQYTVQWHLVMAATLCATLPVAALFAWLQRFLVSGLALGSVK